ncbi:uncharacterized protein LOC126668311 [Mercurialis annua]|uniref:uncharacterized protein LOC126668311 n=1 Tax=Mercurialis annua TaxID=3986 RepID=UPI0021605FEC|nr:uncharacterized protein LOC126668311 [Mercurialis annua]
MPSQTQANPVDIASLINPITRNWKSELIMEMFDREDATKILALPLPYWPHEDKLIWQYSPDGNYTVKSGYFIALNNGFRGYQSLIPHLAKSDWKMLWKLPVPNKIKVFVWRCIHDGLPSGAALQQRLRTPSECKFCGAHETLMHLLYLCPAARQVWFQSPLNFRSSWGPTTDFATHWKSTITKLQEIDDNMEAVPLYCFTLWHIWKQRNSKIFNDVQLTATETIRLILADAEEFKQSQELTERDRRHVSQEQQGQMTVRATPPGFMKINYDAAVDVQRKKGFPGIIAKDASDMQKGKFSATFQFIWDPGILEMLALREAMNWSISRGWNKAIFEGDALQVSNIVNSGQCTISALRGICEDIWRLKTSFTEVFFQYVPRIQNSEAHKWAQQIKHCILT